jgi:hypothetical protein
VFENRVLKNIFEPKRDEVTGEWRKLHNEELCYLYCSTNIRVIKLRRMRWVGYVARMVERRMHTGFWWGVGAERKRQLRVPKCRRIGNINVVLQ